MQGLSSEEGKVDVLTTVLVLVTVGIGVIVIWIFAHLGALRISAAGRVLLAMFCLDLIWFLVATWFWTLTFRKLNAASSWPILFGPTLATEEARRARKWGRRALWAWVLLALLLAGLVVLAWR